MNRRIYTPAYIAGNGRVCSIGTQTSVAEHAAAEVAQLQSEDPENTYFVAFRDLPDWQPTTAAGGGSDV